MKISFIWFTFLVTSCLSGTHEGQQLDSEPSEEISQNNIAQENEVFNALELNNTPSEEQALNSNNSYEEDNFLEEPPPQNMTQGKVSSKFHDHRQSFSQDKKNQNHHPDQSGGYFGYLNAWSSGEVKKNASNPWFEKEGEEKKNKHFFNKHFSFQNGGHLENQYRITRSCPVFQGPSSQTRIRFRLRAGQTIHATRKTGGWLQIGEHSFIHELSVVKSKNQQHHVRRP